ncbi:MAG: hypothetical protein LQ338_006669 [Usnochroma carphineum]|nr:MAG: hypothetical protein LQ338_006669 [Usnochroma carphineum]
MADPPQSSQDGSSGTSGRLRSASMKFLESNPPLGMWHATGDVLAKAPRPAEIRRGSYSHRGWDGELQRRYSDVSEESVRRISRQNSERLSRQSSAQTPDALAKTPTQQLGTHHESREEAQEGTQKEAKEKEPEDDFPNFFGRGEMSDQSFVLKSKRPVATNLLGNVDDEPEERPYFHKKGLPTKFADPLDSKPPKDILSTTAKPRSSSSTTTTTAPPLVPIGPDADGIYPNGYKFPPKHTWGESTLIGLKAFWKFTLTPLGFIIVIYGLNVVAWGGMLFLLLIGGGNAYMCYPPGSHGQKDCNNINSPRRIWIEIDSQILNALFCVTGFGLVPWRFRDLYYLLKWRVGKREDALRKLAGIHRSWFRLPGSDRLPMDDRHYEVSNSAHPAVPIPASKAPDHPLTGIRAPPTALWKLDYVIWAYVLNTFLQAVLSGFMWGLNRYDRPSWSTGTFVALACIVAALGGLMVFLEGKRVKAVEGIPVEEAEVLKDIEKGVEEKKEKKGKRKEKGES